MELPHIEYLHLAFDTLRSQGWRSNLTIIGIVLGITAIITLVSLGEGLNQSVSKQFETLGSNTIIVLPGKTFVEIPFSKLQDNDVDTIESLRGVDFAAEMFIRTSPIEFKGEKKTVMILGIEPDKMAKLGAAGFFELDAGRLITSQDKSGVLIGPKLANEKFKREMHVSSAFFAGDERFKVSGVNKKSKNSFIGSIFDSSVIMNASSVESIAGQKLSPSRIFVRASPGVSAEEIKQRIFDALKKKHRKEDFQVLTPKQIGETAGNVLGIIQIVLIGIAVISLVVGAVGIMNTMFMAVTERTHEIGIMKAIGASNPRILAIFLTEALLIGLIGGVIGTVLGIGLASLASFVATAAGFELNAVISLQTVAFAVLFSMGVGLISGVWPAKTAAELDPVEAIRQGE